MNFLKSYNKNTAIISVIIFLVLTSILTFSVFAVEDNSEPSLPTEDSNITSDPSQSEQSSELQSSEEVSQESLPESSIEGSLESSQESLPESSIESSLESSQESLPESSVESSSESSRQESSNISAPTEESSVPEETSVQESPQESPHAEIADPFAAINRIDIVLPVDKPEYKNPTESSDEISSNVSSSTGNILDTDPPIPPDKTPAVQLYNSTTIETDNSSYLIGIICWSIIGIIITAVFIVFFNSKKTTSSDFELKRNRYHKASPQKSKHKRLLSDKYYK